MHNQDYLKTMNEMGLSTHDCQLERRKAKYPQHFKLKDGRWFITASLKFFLQDCKDIKTSSNKLKGELV